MTGVAYSKDDAKITLQSVQDKPGVAAEIFEPFGKNQINIDMVIKMYHLTVKLQILHLQQRRP